MQTYYKTEYSTETQTLNTEYNRETLSSTGREHQKQMLWYWTEVYLRQIAIENPFHTFSHSQSLITYLSKIVFNQTIKRIGSYFLALWSNPQV